MVLLNRGMLIKKYGNNLYQLIEIDMSNSEIDAIDPKTFIGLPNLTYLWLNHNKISSIDPSLFTGLTNLSRLALHNNMIKAIDSNTFEGLFKLTRLALSNNHIAFIDPKAFHRLKNLEYLSLNNNQLTKLSASTFRELDGSKIKIISLHDNSDGLNSYVQNEYLNKDTTKKSEWEKIVFDKSCCFDFDKFLGQFVY